VQIYWVGPFLGASVGGMSYEFNQWLRRRYPVEDDIEESCSNVSDQPTTPSILYNMEANEVKDKSQYTRIKGQEEEAITKKNLKMSNL